MGYGETSFCLTQFPWQVRAGASAACLGQALRQRVPRWLCHLWLRAALREGSAWHVPTRLGNFILTKMEWE